MRIETSFGEVLIEASYQSEERCIMDGYEFVEELKEGKLYKIVENNKTTYALVEGF